MLSGVLFALLFLGAFSSGSSLSCRWMDHKFGQFSENYLSLLDMLANTEADEVENTVAFPNVLYDQASRASAEYKLAFTTQVLREVAAMFDRDHSKASWKESTVDNFLNVVNKQAHELHSCIGSHSHTKTIKKLQMYFKRLSRHVLEPMDHSAESWELIRKQIKVHLMRADQLASSLLN